MVSIVVGMRLRPLVPCEKGQQHCLRIRDNVVSVIVDVVGSDATKGGPMDFKFDYAMDSTNPKSPLCVGQEKCYELIGKPMLDTILKGFNTCLFCYGQTGTGKTTTIMGEMEPASEQGLLIRLLSDVFGEAAKQRENSCEVHLKAQMLEVYNEKFNDLIMPSRKQGQKVDVHVHPKLGVYVTGATESAVATLKDCIALIEFGNSNKTIAATAMNPQSSRGHTVFKLNMNVKSEADGSELSSEIYFADLAGRENEKTTQVKGQRFEELTYINKSLFWLSSCISSLGHEASMTRRSSTPPPANEARGRRKTLAPNDLPEPSGRQRSNSGRRSSISSGGSGGRARSPSVADAPEARERKRSSVSPAPKKTDMSIFRNSKLTLMLSNVLTGNCRTSLIGTLSPAVKNFSESFTTLKFASTVKAIKLDAKANSKVDKEVVIRNLEEEILKLKEQLQARMNNDSMGRVDSEPLGRARTDAPTECGKSEPLERARTDTPLDRDYIEDLKSQLSAAEGMMATQKQDFGDMLAAAAEEARERGEAALLSSVKSILGPEASAEQVQHAEQHCLLLARQNPDKQMLLDYLRIVQKCKRMVDQANEITDIMKPSSGFYFELMTVSPVFEISYSARSLGSFPELGVRLHRWESNAKSRWRWAAQQTRKGISGAVLNLWTMTTQGLITAEESRDGRGELIALWSWRKFQGRLDMMQRLHAEYLLSPERIQLGSYNPDPWLPWGSGEKPMGSDSESDSNESTKLENEQMNEELTRVRLENDALQDELRRSIVNSNAIKLQVEADLKFDNGKLSNDLAKMRSENKALQDELRQNKHGEQAKAESGLCLDSQENDTEIKDLRELIYKQDIASHAKEAEIADLREKHSRQEEEIMHLRRHLQDIQARVPTRSHLPELDLRTEPQTRISEDAIHKAAFAQAKWISTVKEVMKTQTYAKVLLTAKFREPHQDMRSILSEAIASSLCKHGITSDDVAFLSMDGGGEVQCGVSILSNAPVVMVCDELSRAAADGPLKRALEMAGSRYSDVSISIYWPIKRVKTLIDLHFQVNGRPKYSKLDETLIAKMIPAVVRSYREYTELWHHNSDVELEELKSKHAHAFRQDARDVESLMDDAAAAQKLLKSLLAQGDRDPRARVWEASDYNDHMKIPMADECRVLKSVTLGGSCCDPGIKQKDAVTKKARHIMQPPWMPGDSRPLQVDKVKDVARSNVVFSSVNDLTKFAKRVLEAARYNSQETYGIVWCNNRFATPSCLGHRDLNFGLKFRLPHCGRCHTAELQLQLQSFFDYRQSVGHTVYEELRQILQAAGVEEDDYSYLQTLILDELGCTQGQAQAQFQEMVEESKADITDSVGEQEAKEILRHVGRLEGELVNPHHFSDDFLRNAKNNVGDGLLRMPALESAVKGFDDAIAALDTAQFYLDRNSAVVGFPRRRSVGSLCAYG